MAATVLAYPASGYEYVWNGAGGDDLWSNPANWERDDGVPGAPGPTDDAFILTGPPARVASPATITDLTVGTDGVVEISDSKLTVKQIHNNGEIRLTTAGGPDPGGVLEIDDSDLFAPPVYTGTGRLAASNTDGNELKGKVIDDSLTVGSGTTLKLEALSGTGHLDIVGLELKILQGGQVEFSSLTGTVSRATNDGQLKLLGSSLTVPASIRASTSTEQGTVEVAPTAELTLDSAQIRRQQLIANGSIDVAGGTLEECETTGTVTVSAPTTLETSCLCDLELKEGITLTISGEVGYAGKILATGSAWIGQVNNGILSLLGEIIRGAGDGQDDELIVGAELASTGSPRDLTLVEGTVRLDRSVGQNVSLTISDIAMLEVAAAVTSDSILLEGELLLVGSITGSAISGEGVLLGEGGTLLGVQLDATAAVVGSGSFAKKLLLQGEIKGEKEFVLDSTGGETQLLAVNEVQLPGMTTIAFLGTQNGIRGQSPGHRFVIDNEDQLSLFPANPAARAEVRHLSVLDGGQIQADRVTFFGLQNAGELGVAPSGELTLRDPTDNTGGTICSNDGDATLAAILTGGVLKDSCAEPEGANTDGEEPLEAVTGGRFLVDPTVLGARLIDVASSATIEVLDGGSLDLRDSFINDGVVLVQGELADTTLSFSLDPFSTTTEFHLNGSGEIVFSDSTRNLAPTPDSTFTLFNHANTLRGAVVLGQTDAFLSERVRLINRGRIEADGANPLVIDTGAPGSLFYEVQNEGVVEVTGDGGLRVPDNELINRGEVTIGSGSTLEAPGGFFQYLGSTELGGVMDANVTLDGGTYLGGSQPTTGRLFLRGQMRYELDLDTTVPTTFRMAQDSALIVDVGGFQPGVDHDHLTANSTNLAAWVVMRNLPGFTPQVGDEFEFFEYTGTRNGEFAGVLNGTSVPGLEWELLYGGSEFFGGTVTARVSGSGGSAPDLRLEIEALDDPVSPGGTVTFRHTVTNVGAGTAHAVQLELQLSAGLTLNSVIGATCEESGGMMVCPLGELGPSAQAVVDVTADIDPAATPPLVVSGTVSGLEAEVGTAPNTAQASSFLCTVATDDLVVSHTLVSTEVNEEACVSIHVGPAVEVEAGGALNLRSPLVVIDDGTTVHAGGNLSVSNR